MELTKFLVAHTSQQCCILNPVVSVKIPQILMFVLEEEFVSTIINVVVNLVTQEIIVNTTFVLMFHLPIPKFVLEEGLALHLIFAHAE
jgi:hypothetical protein